MVFKSILCVNHFSKAVFIDILKKISKIAAKILLWILGIVLVLVLTVYVLIRIPAVQQYVLRQVTAYLEKKIETPFRIGGIGLDLPKMLVLEDIYVEIGRASCRE